MDIGRLPSDFQGRFIDKILEILRRGGNIQLAGIPGSGKSVMLSRLAKREDLTEFKFYYFDFNLLVEKDIKAVLEFLAKVLGEDDFEKGLNKVIEQEKITVLILDGFDRLISRDLEPVYRVLKAMNNRWRYRLCYLFAVDSKLVDFGRLDFLGGLGSALCENILDLPMLWKEDAWMLMEAEGEHLGIGLREKEKEEIFYLSGGLMRTMRRLIDAKAKGVEPKDDDNLNFHLADLAKWMKEEGRSDYERFPLLKSFIEEKEGDLTALEEKLWQEMLKRKDGLIDKDELIRSVWGEEGGTEISYHALDQLVHRLRNKVGRGKIKTVFGRGYRIVYN